MKEFISVPCVHISNRWTIGLVLGLKFLVKKRGIYLLINNTSSYDCTGRVLYEWNGTGLARVHSNECAYCGPLKNSGVLVKNCGTAHGLFETALPCTNWSQMM